MAEIKSFVVGVMLLFPVPVWAAPVLVNSGWLAKHIDSKNVAVIDMSAEDTQYDRFHLPGATRLPNYALVMRGKKDKFSKPIPADRLAKILGQLGITSKHHIVIYDDMGGLQAGRLFWQLEAIGHKEVSVLDGGLVKWILEGRKVVNTPVKRTIAQYSLTSKTRNNLATMEDVKRASESGETILLDVRSEEEYIGDLKKRRGGHVPGARWWPWQQAVNFNNGFTRAAASKIKTSLQKVGVRDAGQPVITYCYSGHRAAQSYLTLRSLGYENVRLYARSMAEYGLYKSSPLKLGRKP